MAGRKHVGIIDEEKAKTLKFFAECDAQKQKVQDWITQEEQGLIIADADNPVNVSEAQKGKPIPFEKFERLIRKLPMGASYVFRDINPLFKGLCFNSPQKGLISVSAYGKTLLPEYSTITVEKEKVRDFSLNVLKPIDMPEMKWDPVAKEHVAKDGSLLPGWKYRYKTIGENPYDPTSRGYRTVLMRIVKLGLATPEEVEKVFGKSSRASWGSLHRSDTGYKF